MHVNIYSDHSSWYLMGFLIRFANGLLLLVSGGWSMAGKINKRPVTNNKEPATAYSNYATQFIVFVKARIFDIKRFAIHDGPGIRVTAFFKGCPMNCWWCHNPEGILPVVESDGPVAGMCLSDRSDKGRLVDVKELYNEMMRDRVFFEESGGGITISGGEPLMQPGALSALLKLFNKSGIHTCIDTSGHAEGKDFRNINPYTDLYLYDLKMIDDKKHLKYTGVTTELILENLEYLAGTEKEVHIRWPVIPGINDTEKDLEEMRNYLSQFKGRFHQVDLLPYHGIGRSKYEKHGMKYKLNHIKEPGKDHLNNIKNSLEGIGFASRIGG